MTKSEILSGRLKEVLLNGTWIAGTNLQEQLKSTTWEKANYKIGQHNSIAELTFHINYYVEGILNVFNGGDLEIRDRYSFDMKSIESDSDWQNLISLFVTNARSLVQKISSTAEDQWKKNFVKEEYGSYERNIEGLIEHSYYHFGQISLLRKLFISSATIT